MIDRQMRIDRVTVTGADDSVDVSAMKEIQRDFPFVEWGILLSRSSEGRNRFPSLPWMCKLVEAYEHHKHPLKLSGHICGQWVRDICQGNWTFLAERPQICGYFRRFQLNFHALVHQIKDKEAFIRGFSHPVLDKSVQIIFQLDDVNNGIWDLARDNYINVAALFDTSHGVGVLPDFWPCVGAIDVVRTNLNKEGVAQKNYYGYAGGLGPENLEEQLEKISRVCGGNPIWIDAETKLRSEDDLVFDLDKVVKFLEIAKPWIVEQEN